MGKSSWFPERSFQAHPKTSNPANKSARWRRRRIFWANAGLGAASVPDYWKVFHAGDCTVHRSEISLLGGNEGDNVALKNGAQFRSDYVILCTGFDKSYHPFSEELQEECGLRPRRGDAADAEKWAALEARAEHTVDELLPSIREAPLEATERRGGGGQGGEKTKEPLHGPSRHYRRLVVPSMAASGDRSVYFPGFIHSIYTPLVSEVQALWGVSFLLDLHDAPPRPEMEREVAEWNVWTRKRYLTQGKKHAYAIYDFLSVSLPRAPLAFVSDTTSYFPTLYFFFLFPSSIPTCRAAEPS